jgi:hypothetical protein
LIPGQFSKVPAKMFWRNFERKQSPGSAAPEKADILIQKKIVLANRGSQGQ